MLTRRMATMSETQTGKSAGVRLTAFLPLVACFAAGLLVALAAIPPWQNPDEPQHLLTVRLVLSHGPDFDLERDIDPAAEREIVSSMAAYGWWNHYGAATPNPLPATFADGPAKVTASYFGPPGGGSRLYYRGMAALFGGLGIDGVLSQLYTMRLVSALVALVALWGVWSGTLTLVGATAASAITAAIALHPQFTLVSTTASPDAVVNLAGAFVWRQSAVLLTAGVSSFQFAGLWAASIGAVVTRRMGAPLIVVAAIVTFVVIVREIAARGARWRPAMAGLVAIALVAVAVVVAGSDLVRAFSWMRFDPQQSVASIAERVEAIPAFFDMLYQTFWLSGGWLRHPAPGAWYGITSILAAVSVVGLLILVLGRHGHQALWFSAALLLFQVAAVLAYYFGIVRSGPQGRYLFPIMPAIFCLIWLGWHAIAGRLGTPRIAAASLVFLMAFLNTTAWLYVLLPAYL